MLSKGYQEEDGVRMREECKTNAKLSAGKYNAVWGATKKDGAKIG